MAELIKMLFAGESTDLYGYKEPCIRWGPDRTYPFASAKGEKTAMRSNDTCCLFITGEGNETDI